MPIGSTPCLHLSPREGHNVASSIWVKKFPTDTPLQAHMNALKPLNSINIIDKNNVTITYGKNNVTNNVTIDKNNVMVNVKL